MPTTLVREVASAADTSGPTSAADTSGPTSAAVTSGPTSAAVTRLRVALARSSRLLRATPTAQQLTPTQLQLLGVLVRESEMGMAELQKHEGLNPTMLSRSIGNLEAQGLVARTPGDQDKRSVRVAVTDAGQELHARARAEADARLAEHLGALDEDDVRTLVGALPALERLAERLRGER